MAEDGGKYPDGNSLLVTGDTQSVLIDPALGLTKRVSLPRVDRILHSHCHEDHFAGSYLFPDVPWHYHEADAPSARSLDAVMGLYGYPLEIDAAWRERLVEKFNFVPCEEPVPFRNGDIFDLGGCSLRVVHLPGHTWGHCAFHILPDDVLYLGDIELSSFGPYYGDACGDLVEFERSLAAVRDFQATHYATFHHIGVLDREGFLARLDKFVAKIGSREQALLAFLKEPRSMDEIVDHRFVFRPGDELLYADSVERHSMSLHLERLMASGGVEQIDGGRYLAR